MTLFAPPAKYDFKIIYKHLVIRRKQPETYLSSATLVKLYSIYIIKIAAEKFMGGLKKGGSGVDINT